MFSFILIFKSAPDIKLSKLRQVLARFFLFDEQSFLALSRLIVVGGDLTQAKTILKILRTMHSKHVLLKGTGTESNSKKGLR